MHMSERSDSALRRGERSRPDLFLEDGTAIYNLPFGFFRFKE
jgi:hypothetical protein